MNQWKNAAVCCLLITTTALSVCAQKVRLLDGDLAPLRGESKIVLAYAYDNMRVGKFDNGDEYVRTHKEELNKKEPGRGDNWEKAWVADRKNRFEPKFADLYAKYSPLAPMATAKYTLIFKTVFTEPGFNVGVWKKNAEIDGEAWIVETDHPDHVIAKLTVSKAPGRSFWGNDYDTGARLEESYAVAGRGVGKFLKSKL